MDYNRRMRERRAAAFRGAFVKERGWDGKDGKRQTHRKDKGTEMLSRRTKIRMYES